jgi:hypothetical protein
MKTCNVPDADRRVSQRIARLLDAVDDALRASQAVRRERDLLEKEVERLRRAEKLQVVGSEG